MIALQESQYAELIVNTLQEHNFILPDQVEEMIEYIMFSDLQN